MRLYGVLWIYSMKSGIFEMFLGGEMRLLAGEIMRYYCDFRRRICHISERVYMGVREKTCK